MSTFKKVLALTLALAMVLSVSVFAGYSKNTYKDSASINPDCEAAVELMYALEIMKGDDKGNFNPEATITRGEMAKMIYVILNYGDDDLAVNYKGAKFFSDVNAGDWYEGYVNYMAMTKLVQGRPDGTFGPNDPVTTAEAAKMLLTALGYSAELRGYVGANWATNVLRDAAILELLKGYNYSTTGYAPRQWVAVMVENAMNCKTLGTMYPSFDGLLTSGYAGSHQTLGEKYYNYAQFTDVAVATKKTTLEKDFSENGILFSEGKDLSGTGLTVEDLGQEFKVITVKGKVVSVRNTGVSVVAEALLRDVDAKTITGTSSNKYNNKYEFTIDELTAKFDGEGVNQITLGNEADKVKAVECKDTDLYSQSNGKYNNQPTEIKAIDKDGDGDIDYCVFTVYNYAVVAKTGTSRAYGDYVVIEDKNEKEIEWNDGEKLYVDDVIICDDTLEAGNYIKYNYDHENDNMLAVEVLPVAEETLDRVTNKGTYTIGGDVYVTSDAADAFGDFTLLKKDNVDETFVIAYDGDMLVVVAEPESEPTTLDEINAQLCVVTDVTDHYYTGWDKVKAVEILTIDNEKAQYVLADQDIELADINVVTNHCKDGFTNYLYVFSVNDDEEITLSPFAATAEGLKALDEKEDVINGYWTADFAEWTKVSDDFLGDIIELGNTYFVGSVNSKGKFSIEAKTLEDLAGMKALDVHFEGLYDCGKYLNTVVAGYISAQWTENDSISDGYLYLNEEVYYDKANKEYTVEVTFADGTVETITIANSDVEALDMYVLYSFSYSELNDEYTLTAVEAEQKTVEITVEETKDLDVLTAFDATTKAGTKSELVEGFNGDEIYVKEAVEGKKVQRYDLTDCVIAVKNITLDLDKFESDVIEVTYEIEFVTLDELKEMETIFADYEDRHDFYYSDFTYAAEDLMYIEVYRVTDECQDVLDAQ